MVTTSAPDSSNQPSAEGFRSGFVLGVKAIFRFFSTVKLAVVVLLSLTASLATATILESLYDTPTAQYYVYRSGWFHFILAFLGVNIFCSAMSRWPWKKHHIPFLVAHLGILTLLTGSWMTEQFGVDGNLRVSETQSQSIVEMETPVLLLIENDRVARLPMKWLPPQVEFKPFSIRDRGLDYDLVVDRYLSHADALYSFVPKTANVQAMGTHPALKLTLSGGPMQIVQDFWLWTGDPSYRSVQAGPAHIEFLGEGEPEPAHRPGQPTLFLFYPRVYSPDAIFRFKSYASDGNERSARFKMSELANHAIEPGWKNVKIVLNEWVTDAQPQASYVASRVQFGQFAPSSAIHVKAGQSADSDIWLGLGDRAVMNLGDRKVEIAYYPQRLVLPFTVRLDHFTVQRYDGTADPSSYESDVTVSSEQTNSPSTVTKISMNEPLQYQGYTLYQASYEDAQPRPVTSIFSVNRDPGRRWKYLGSLLIVFGSILLFARKYAASRARNKSAGAKAL